jgi:hypothetical protein
MGGIHPEGKKARSKRGDEKSHSKKVKIHQR